MTSLPSSKPQPEPQSKEKGPLRALLASAIDFAGLFPPADLDMASAARAYARYRRSQQAWMLGAFVVPAARASELVSAVARFAPGETWPASVLVPSLAEGTRFLGDGRGGSSDAIDVQALEVAPLEAEAIRGAPGDGVDGVPVFYEVPLDARMEARLDAIARAGGAAKVRTGGVRPQAFPSAGRLAEFVYGCAQRNLAFKATAGLHHPVRGRYALTYDPGSEQAAMYGFLELTLIAELLRSRRIDAVGAARLLSGEATHLDFEAGAVRWRGYRITSSEISSLRSDFFRSFGSCSFEDPVADLKRIGLL